MRGKNNWIVVNWLAHHFKDVNLRILAVGHLISKYITSKY